MLTLHRLGTLECIGDIEMWNKVIQSPDPRDRDSRLSSNAFSMVIAGTIRQAALQRDWGEGHNPCSYISIARRFVISRFELRNRFSTGADRTTKPKKNSKLKEPEQEAFSSLAGSGIPVGRLSEAPAGSVRQHIHDATRIHET